MSLVDLSSEVHAVASKGFLNTPVGVSHQAYGTQDKENTPFDQPTDNTVGGEIGVRYSPRLSQRNDR
jgi:hypothetical protein